MTFILTAVNTVLLVSLVATSCGWTLAQMKTKVKGLFGR